MNPYDILRLDKSETYSQEEIEDAYRERVKVVHPDQGGSATEFKLVRDAYQELSEYDQTNHEETVSDQTKDTQRTHTSADTYIIEFLDYDAVVDNGWELTDNDLFSKASQREFGDETYGTFNVPSGQTVLEAAEKQGHTWPFACRGGACANCAVLIKQGEINESVDHVLPEKYTQQGFRLSCIGHPVTSHTQLIFNVKTLPDLDTLRLPPQPFKNKYQD